MSFVSKSLRHNPHIFIIAPHFAPDNSSGTYRTLALAKYLIESGWSISVLTVSQKDIVSRDDALLDDHISKMQILRVSKLDLADILKESLKFMASARQQEHNAASKRIDKPDKYFRVSSRAVRVFWPLYLPDHFLQWAVRSLANVWLWRLAGECNCLYSSGPPHSAHLVGAILKLKWRVPWVADLRDPWAGNPLKVYPSNTLAPFWDRWLERKVLSQADRIVCNTAMMEAELAARYPFLTSRLTYVLNGFDENVFSENGDKHLVDPQNLVVSHVGTLYGQRDPRCLFRAFAQLKEKHPRKAEDFQFVFAGPGTENFQSEVRHYRLEPFIKIMGPMQRQEALNLDRRATVLLCLGLTGTEHQTQVPAKLYQFIGLGKPVLAVTPRKSSVLDVLTSSGVQYFWADPEDEKSIVEKLLEIHQLWQGGGLVFGGNTRQRMRFSRRERCRELESILLSACDRRRR